MDSAQEKNAALRYMPKIHDPLPPYLLSVPVSLVLDTMNVWRTLHF